MVRIVTDSTADLSPAQQKQMGITVVPLNVHFGDQVYRDRVDITGAEFFSKLQASSQMPRTSQPSVGVFEEAFRQLLRDGDEVVAVVLSAKVSGTYNSALMAAQSVDASRIEIVDSQSASMAEGFMALEAARLAQQGAGRKQVAEHTRSLVPKGRILAAIDTLIYLERGGRIGKAQALLGSLLHVKPIITLQDGEVHPLGRARSRAQVLDRLVEMLKRDGKLSHLAVMHGGAAVEAEQMRKRIAPDYPELEVTIAETGPVIGTHTGPGVIGFTYLVA